MLDQNPFLLREVRQLLRPGRTIKLYGVGAAAGMGFWLLLVCAVAPTRFGHRGLPAEVIYLSLVVHGVFCVLAGIFGGNRIFADEHRTETLESLYLLPYGPARWLFAKLVFPVYVVVMTWALGLPVYFFTAMYRLGRLTTALSLSLLPLAGGLAVVMVILLLPPDYRDRMHRLATVSGTRAPHLDRDMLVRSLLLGAIFLTLMGTAAWQLSGGSLGAAAPLYSGTIPSWLFWTMLIGPLLAAAWATALSNIDEEEQAQARAAAFRLIALLGLYYLALGLLWRYLPAWGRIAGFVVLPAAGMLLTRSIKRPREDRRSGDEIAWLAARWDDALLLRDFRAYSRYASVRRGLLLRGATLALFVAGQALLITWAFDRKLSGGIHPLGWALGFLTVLPVVFLPAIQPSQCWLKERTSQTLEMLLLTPLGTRAMLRSRLLAGALYFGVVFGPVFILLAVAVGAALSRGFWIAGPAAVAFLPIPLTMVLALEAAERPESPVRQADDTSSLATLLAVVELGCFCASLGLAAIGGHELRVEAAWTVSLVLFALSAAAGWIAFHVRVGQLQSLRAGA